MDRTTADALGQLTSRKVVYRAHGKAGGLPCVCPREIGAALPDMAPRMHAFMAADGRRRHLTLTAFKSLLAGHPQEADISDALDRQVPVARRSGDNFFHRCGCGDCAAKMAGGGFAGESDAAVSPPGGW